MKKCIILIIAVLSILLYINMHFAAADTWMQKADFGGTVRYRAVGFSIGSKGYIGTGYDGSLRKDFWEYDPVANTWTQKADFGGTARSDAVGFSVGGKGYIGTGWDGSDYCEKDFWEYDPVANTWTQKADFGGTARCPSIGFSIGGKGYIGTGWAGINYKDFWEYNPVANTWTQKANFGGTARYDAVGFSIGSKGYIGTGRDDSGEKEDFWEYDPVANTWTQKANFGGTARYMAVGFSVGSKGYIGTGSGGSRKDDFWEYDPVANTWTRKANFWGTSRCMAVGFSIGSKGYIGTGNVDGFPDRRDFWEYSPNTAPDQFTFTDQWNVALTTVITSNTITVSGIDAAVYISITGGAYSVNSGPYTSAEGRVNNGDAVTVQQTSSGSYSTTTNATLTIGGVSDTFSVTTQGVPPDTTPDQFTFTDYTYVPLNTMITSNIITVSGINVAAPISITGGQYAIYDWRYGWLFTSADGWVTNGNLVLVRQYSSGNYSTTTNATLTIGGVSDTFSLTTLNDTTPNPFFFNDRIGVPLNTWFSSNTITVSGISAAAPISITGGLYSINYMPYTSASGTVNNGSMVTVRQASSGSYSTTTNATLTIGGVSDTFSVTTQAAPPDTTPDQFTFTDQTGVALSTVITSNTITVSGIVTAAPISITGGTYSINGGSYTSANGTVNNGDTVRVQQTSSGNYSTTTNATLTIGGVSDTFSVTTQAAPPDTTPDQFSFIDQTGVALSTVLTSNTITVAGINTAAPISIVGGTYSINSGSSTSADGTVSNGDTVTVQQTSSGNYSTTTNAMLNIGGVSDTFSVTTQAVPVANTWTQKADFGGTARQTPVGFSIGSKGYVGTGGEGDGILFYKDFWEYDAAANTWTQKADFGGTARYYAVGFSIWSKGYIGTGYDGSRKNDFWEYDPALNAWTQKADFGGTARQGAVGFSIGSKGYIGTGFDGSRYKDFWEYDPALNAWTQKADFGGTARYGAVGFSIGSKGYIGTGYDGSSKKDFWEYDPAANSWTEKADFGGTARYYAVGFTIGSKGYIGTGNASSYTKDFWEYDPAANSWTEKADFGGTARCLTAGFSVGSKGYVGMGYSSGSNYKDFWEYETADSAPDQFTFTDQTGVALSAVITSNTITVSGINITATISIAGGTYAINAGSYTSAGGTVNNGDTITVQQTSSGNYSTTTNATLTIGGVSDTFSVTTLAAPSDTTPDQFTFTDQTGVALSTVITSNTITVSGINAAGAISITGGQYSTNGGFYTSAGGTVNNGNTVTVQQTSSGNYSTTTNATLTIGGVSDTFSVTTQAAPPDTTPDQCTFTDQTGVALSTVITSNTITVSGIVTAAPISITGGTYAINGGSYTSANSTVNNGNTVTVQQTSSGNYSTTTDATLTIGRVSDTFSVTTQAAPPDTTPDQFTFTDRTGVALSTAITSNTIAVAGISTVAPISIVGGQYAINGGSYTSDDGTVSNGDTVTVQQTSSGSYSTTTNATLTIGGVSDTFSVTTQAAPIANTWTQKADFGGTARQGAVGFSIGSKGYVGTGGEGDGILFYKDFWEYDAAANTWTQKADFGGTARQGAVGFSIWSKGYIGTGYDGSRKNDLWEYDPALNAWTQKGDFGGTARQGAVGFSIGSKGYIGTGYDGSSKKDFWEYDPAANSWTEKADFGGTARYYAVGFSIGSRGYIGTGFDGSSKNDFWEYDPAANSWTEKADFGGTARYQAVGFSIESKGYIGTGYASSYIKDFWEYAPAANSWTEKADFGGTVRCLTAGFSIGSKGYIGTGYYSGSNYKDFWEYEPPDTTPDQFTFTDQTGVALSTVITSNTITVSGIVTAAPISITGGTYAINGGSYTSASGTVNNGDTVTVQQTSSGSDSTTTDATLTIGGVSDTFSVTTVVQQFGTLSVTTTLVSGGITVDGTFKANGSWSGSVATGSHMVSFGSVSGYDTPANQTVTVNNGQTTNVTGTYTQQFGSLTVTISPQGAIDAGAQWKRVGTPTWFNSGSTENTIPVGSYTVEFKTVPGWTTPSSVGVTISNGATATVSRTYDQLVGTVVVNPGPNSINAPWTLTGPHSYSRSGTGDATIMNLPIGQYTLTWGDVTGWKKPSSSTVTQTLTTSGTTTFSGTYIQDGMFYIIPNRKGGGAVIYL